MGHDDDTGKSSNLFHPSKIVVCPGLITENYIHEYQRNKLP